MALSANDTKDLYLEERPVCPRCRMRPCERRRGKGQSGFRGKCAICRAVVRIKETGEVRPRDKQRQRYIDVRSRNGSGFRMIDKGMS